MPRRPWMDRRRPDVRSIAAAIFCNPGAGGGRHRVSGRDRGRRRRQPLRSDGRRGLDPSGGSREQRGPVPRRPPRGPVGAPGDGLAPSGAIALQPAPAGPGGSALLLLPDQHTSAMRRLLFVTGAQGMVYLVDRDRIAGLTGGRGAAGSSVSSRCVFGPCGGGPGGIPADEAYWDGGARAGPMVFVPGRGPQPPPCSGTGGVVALRLRAGGESSMPRLDVAWCSASMHDPGAPSVSGVGPAGVVWVTDQDETPVLRALDAGTGAPLYESRIPAGGGAAQPPVTPAVAGGRVYVAAGHLVRAFGLW